MRIWFACLLFALGPLSVSADTTQEIIDRCRETMGEHGAAMVKDCVDDDREAHKEVMVLMARHPNITSRCLDRFEKHGYTLVLDCAQDDIAAERALSEY